MAKIKLTFFLVIVVMTVIILTNLQYYHPTKFYLRSKKEYKILLWTQFYSSDEWIQSLRDDYQCQYSNCVLTNNRSDIDSNDVLLFHWRDINVLDLPKEKKAQHQTWVLFNMESPIYTYMKFPAKIFDIKLFESIDWVMTYRKDSDVIAPYGQVVKCHKDWKPKHNLQNKTKQIAWIVSHCETSSQRELLVDQLKNFIQIDVYGGCGQHSCPQDESCFDMIQRNYKFYLSFENSLCKDYVTEKLFRTLQYDIIPIVFGSADYSSLLPHNSYIDVFNFTSVPQLITYLNHVSTDPELYASYFEWKKEFSVQRMEDKKFCQLCQRLNEEAESWRWTWKGKRGHDLAKWWVETAQCKTVQIN